MTLPLREPGKACLSPGDEAVLSGQLEALAKICDSLESDKMHIPRPHTTPRNEKAYKGQA